MLKRDSGLSKEQSNSVSKTASSPFAISCTPRSTAPYNPSTLSGTLRRLTPFNPFSGTLRRLIPFNLSGTLRRLISFNSSNHFTTICYQQLWHTISNHPPLAPQEFITLQSILTQILQKSTNTATRYLTILLVI